MSVTTPAPCPEAASADRERLRTRSASLLRGAFVALGLAAILVTAGCLACPRCPETLSPAHLPAAK